MLSGSFFFFNYFILYVWALCLHVGLCITCVSWRLQERTKFSEIGDG